MMKTFEDAAEFVRAHQELADLVIARRIEEARAKLAVHLAATLALVYPAESEARS